MAIDIGRAASKYNEITPMRADAWAAGATANADKWDRNAKSQQAETNYKLGTEYAAQNQLRLKGLQSVTAADFAGGVNASREIYRAKVSGAGDKWARKFEPFASVIDRTVPGLPAKVAGDIRGNIERRTVPVAVALHDAKVRGVTGRVLGTPAPVSTPRYGAYR